MKHQPPYRYGLVNVAIWPKIFGNKVAILNSVLIIMDYFFGCQKSTLDLENEQMLMSRIFFAYHVTGTIYSNFFPELCISQGYIQNCERTWKNSVCIRINNLAKSANSQFHESLHKEKNWNYKSLKTTPCWKINFCV